MTNSSSFISPAIKLRVLIIGAGHRVQNNFLPVLSCLDNQFEIVGIHSRTAENLLPVAKRWSVPAVQSLVDIDWSRIDIVVISVTTSQNAVVMNQLLSHASRLRLIIDTPIAWKFKELLSCAPLLHRFQKVLVAEDYMNFPIFTLIRKAIADSLIGAPRAITLYNAGYYYHGLALIRSFADFSIVWRSRCQAAGTFTTNVHYYLGRRFRACVVGPYREHENGGILFEGDKGIITEVAGDAQFGFTKNRPVYHVTKCLRNNQLSGYKIQDAEGNILYTLDLPHMQEMRDMSFEDKSDPNLLRSCGLISIFQALIDPVNINNNYGTTQALYDSFVSRLISKGMLPIDPFFLAGKNIMLPLQLLARFLKFISIICIIWNRFLPKSLVQWGQK